MNGNRVRYLSYSVGKEECGGHRRKKYVVSCGELVEAFTSHINVNVGEFVYH